MNKDEDEKRQRAMRFHSTVGFWKLMRRRSFAERIGNLENRAQYRLGQRIGVPPHSSAANNVLASTRQGDRLISKTSGVQRLCIPVRRLKPLPGSRLNIP